MGSEDDGVDPGDDPGGGQGVGGADVLGVVGDEDVAGLGDDPVAGEVDGQVVDVALGGVEAEVGLPVDVGVLDDVAGSLMPSWMVRVTLVAMVFMGSSREVVGGLPGWLPPRCLTN